MGLPHDEDSEGSVGDHRMSRKVGASGRGSGGIVRGKVEGLAEHYVFRQRKRILDRGLEVEGKSGTGTSNSRRRHSVTPTSCRLTVGAPNSYATASTLVNGSAYNTN